MASPRMHNIYIFFFERDLHNVQWCLLPLATVFSLSLALTSVLDRGVLPTYWRKILSLVHCTGY